MSNTTEVVSTNLSTEKGTLKRPVDRVTVDRNGIVGDAHAGSWHRQISILAQESIDRFARTNDLDISPGDFAENITLRGIDLSQACVLDRLRIGAVELQVTQIGKECHGDECAIFRQVGECIMPTEGVFCAVVSGGTIAPGDEAEYIPRPLEIAIITLSDRASRGEYEDRSGPRIRQVLEDYFHDTRWRHSITVTVLPDDASTLTKRLHAAREDSTDIIFTTGGTGVGPRDITPEVVRRFCDKTIPGIMDMVRIKYGADNPNALLSRSVAGTAGRMLVYALPGSVKAVEEYMNEILLTMEHLLLTVNGLDAH